MTKSTICLGLLLSVASVPAWGEPIGGLGHWQGKGTTFALGSSEKGEFTVDLTRTAIDAHTVEMKGTVVLDDGRVIPITQRLTETERGFAIEGNRGKGGGRCYGDGLCNSYEEGADGKSFATTIVIDGSEHLRLLTTELDHGRAVRVMRQNLVKKP
jgi:hypothetical protein